MHNWVTCPVTSVVAHDFETVKFLTRQSTGFIKLLSQSANEDPASGEGEYVKLTMSRGAGSKSRTVDVDFNPLGENLANNFLQARSQNSFDPRHDADRVGNGKLIQEKGDPSNRNSPFLNDRGERDVWAAGGEHLSTNKLSLMLSDMQV